MPSRVKIGGRSPVVPSQYTERAASPCSMPNPNVALRIPPPLKHDPEPFTFVQTGKKPGTMLPRQRLLRVPYLLIRV